MRRFLAAVLAAALLTAGCSPGQPRALTLATTTSTQDSGLLDVLVPRFRARTGIEVKVVAVGTGQALEWAARRRRRVARPRPGRRAALHGRGLRHRPPGGHAQRFRLVGPPADPAGVKGQASAAEAFARIARSGSPFVSRGDESGTHQKEKAVWRQADVEPRGDWYLSAGAGMGQVLRLASEKQAYTLSDRGTFLALRQGLNLAVLAEGDPLLVNPYHVIVVNPAKHPHAHRREAEELADFLMSPEGQGLIADFGKDRFGQPLFFVGATAG